MDDVRLSFVDRLQEAVDAAEVGFHFEEGGCYGMALALRAALIADGVPCRIVTVDDLGHAMVEVGAMLLDYAGDRTFAYGTQSRSVFEGTDDEFVTMVVAASANDEDSILSDRDLAADLVANAKELARPRDAYAMAP